MPQYIITPTSLLKKKCDFSGRYFSMIPCEMCDTIGAGYEVRIYHSPPASYSHLDFLLRVKGTPVDLDDFTGVRGPTSQEFFCSEECVNLWILSYENKRTYV